MVLRSTLLPQGLGIARGLGRNLPAAFRWGIRVNTAEKEETRAGYKVRGARHGLASGLLENRHERLVNMRVRADQGLFEWIRLIKPIGQPLSIGDTPTCGLDDCHASTDIPLISRVVSEYPLVTSCRHQTTLISY